MKIDEAVERIGKLISSAHRVTEEVTRDRYANLRFKQCRVKFLDTAEDYTANTFIELVEKIEAKYGIDRRKGPWRRKGMVDRRATDRGLLMGQQVTKSCLTCLSGKSEKQPDGYFCGHGCDKYFVDDSPCSCWGGVIR